MNRDFASMLDDLFVAAKPEPEASAPRPTIPFDYLSVADELHSGRIKVSDDAVAAEYREASASLEDELAALIADVETPQAEPAPVEEPLPPVEPAAIAIELGLGSARPADFGPLRRRFALKNHPDRVAPHLRQRALVRMQVANMLIDEAKRRAGTKKV